MCEGDGLYTEVVLGHVTTTLDSLVVVAHACILLWQDVA